MLKKTTYRILLAGLLLLAASLACRALVPGGSAGQSNPEAAVSENGTVNVAADEFEFRLDATQAEAGVVTFVVTNEGQMEHDFAISGQGIDERTPMLQPGESATLEVELEPGAYEFVCTVPGHAMLGMSGTFTVTG